MTIIIRSAFEEDAKLYPQLFFRSHCVWVSVKMLQYEKSDFSEVIDVKKTIALKECELCHYWFFKNVGCKFEEFVCNGCHDLLTIAYSSENIATLNAKGAPFRCILWAISGDEGLRRLNSSEIENKSVL